MVVQTEVDWEELCREAVTVDAEGADIEPYVSVSFCDAESIPAWWSGSVTIDGTTFEVSFDLSDVRRLRKELIATYSVKATS